jgi:hypothetical protein
MTPPVPPLSWQQSPQKSLQRTLSDESLCSGRREPSFASPASLEPGLPSDVLFTSTCSFPSSTLPARRQHQHAHPHSGGGPSTIPEKKRERGQPGLGGRGSHLWGHLQSCVSEESREGTRVHTSFRVARWLGPGYHPRSRALLAPPGSSESHEHPRTGII